MVSNLGRELAKLEEIGLVDNTGPKFWHKASMLGEGSKSITSTQVINWYLFLSSLKGQKVKLTSAELEIRM